MSCATWEIQKIQTDGNHHYLLCRRRGFVIFFCLVVMYIYMYICMYIAICIYCWTFHEHEIWKDSPRKMYYGRLECVFKWNIKLIDSKLHTSRSISFLYLWLQWKTTWNYVILMDFIDFCPFRHIVLRGRLRESQGYDDGEFFTSFPSRSSLPPSSPLMIMTLEMILIHILLSPILLVLLSRATTTRMHDNIISCVLNKCGVV